MTLGMIEHKVEGLPARNVTEHGHFEINGSLCKVEIIDGRREAFAGGLQGVKQATPLVLKVRRYHTFGRLPFSREVEKDFPEFFNGCIRWPAGFYNIAVEELEEARVDEHHVAGQLTGGSGAGIGSGIHPLCGDFCQEAAELGKGSIQVIAQLFFVHTIVFKGVWAGRGLTAEESFSQVRAYSLPASLLDRQERCRSRNGPRKVSSRPAKAVTGRTGGSSSDSGSA